MTSFRRHVCFTLLAWLTGMFLGTALRLPIEPLWAVVCMWASWFAMRIVATWREEENA